MPERPLCFVLMPFGRKPDPAGGVDIDFDVIYDRGLRPGIEDAGMTPIRADEEQLGGIIHQAHPRTLRRLARRRDTADSPLFQLVSAWRPEQLPAAPASTFREQAEAAEELKRRLDTIRSLAGSPSTREEARAAFVAIHKSPVENDSADAGVFTGLLLAYRALDDWSGMIDVYEALPDHLRRPVSVRHLVAFAHNRRAEDQDNARRTKDRKEALDLLRDVEREQGPTSETYGLRGRIYKSHWAETFAAGDDVKAEGLLKHALDAYLGGFETDWRDYYPGVNALTLLDVRGTEESLADRDRLVPVVRFALEHKARSSSTDYWISATRLELAVLDNDEPAARRALGEALAQEPEGWQRGTTADNLRLIRRARCRRSANVTWLDPLITALDPPARPPEP
jgi:hypothetical protein